MKYYKQVSIKQGAHCYMGSVPIGTIAKVIGINTHGIITYIKPINDATSIKLNSRFKDECINTDYWKWVRISKTEAFEIML